MQMPGDELTESGVTEILRQLYKVSNKEKVFCPFCDVRLLNLNLNLAACARMPTATIFWRESYIFE